MAVNAHVLRVIRGLYGDNPMSEPIQDGTDYTVRCDKHSIL
jgi:hypothetical protein